MSSSIPDAIPFRNESEVATALPRVLEHLRAMKCIAYPTETVYGLGGAATADAVRALNRLKVRSTQKSFLLLVAGEQMIEQLGMEWNDAAHALARKHWPGPLTLVLRVPPTQLSLPADLLGPGGGVAVRWTSHPSILRLLSEYGSPLTSTSANVSDAQPAASAAEVMLSYDDAVRHRTLMLLDGGELPPSPPSTVIDCTEKVPRLLRPGAISATELRKTTPELIANE